MLRRRSHDSLMPPGLGIDHVEIGGTEIVAVARSRAVAVSCPGRGRMSARIHSRDRRCIADPPAHGRRVRILLAARRFRCGSLALQLRPTPDVGFPCGGLMSSSPSGPGDDEGRLDLPQGEAGCYPADFLD